MIVRQIKIALLGFLVLLSDCSEKRVRLIDNFYSYQSEREFDSLIDNAITKVGTDVGLSDVVIKYQHLGEDGKLGLRFLEDQLAAVGFYPSDTLSYLKKLNGSLNITFASGPRIVRDNVEIFKGYDYEIGSVGGMFVSWKDPVLVEKYSGKIW